MMPRIAVFTLFLLTPVVIATAAEPVVHVRDLPAGPTTRVEIEAAAEMEVTPTDENLVRVKETIERRDGLPAGDESFLRVDEADGAVRIRMRSFPDERLKVKIEIEIPPTASVAIEAEKGRVMTDELAGPIDAKIHGGALVIARHRGPIRAEIDKGRLEIAEFLGSHQPVSVTGEQGVLQASIGAIEPGPGLIRLKRGDVRFSIAMETKVALQAQVSEIGQVITAGPIPRPDPKALFFRANGGTQVWGISLEKGSITADFPIPPQPAAAAPPARH